MWTYFNKNTLLTQFGQPTAITDVISYQKVFCTIITYLYIYIQIIQLDETVIM